MLLSARSLKYFEIDQFTFFCIALKVFSFILGNFENVIITATNSRPFTLI